VGQAPDRPTWQELAVDVGHELADRDAGRPPLVFPDAYLRQARGAVDDRPQAAKAEDPVPADVLADLLAAAAAERGLDDQALERLAARWFARAGPDTAELIRRALLGLRAASTPPETARATFARALTGPVTLLDRPLLRLAARHLHPSSPGAVAGTLAELCPEDAPQRRLDPGAPPEQSRHTGRVRRFDQAGDVRWSFPPVRLPVERARPTRGGDARGRVLGVKVGAAGRRELLLEQRGRPALVVYLPAEAPLLGLDGSPCPPEGLVGAQVRLTLGDEPRNARGQVADLKQGPGGATFALTLGSVRRAFRADADADLPADLAAGQRVRVELLPSKPGAEPTPVARVVPEPRDLVRGQIRRLRKTAAGWAFELVAGGRPLPLEVDGESVLLDPLGRALTLREGLRAQAEIDRRRRTVRRLWVDVERRWAEGGARVSPWWAGQVADLERAPDGALNFTLLQRGVAAARVRVPPRADALQESPLREAFDKPLHPQALADGDQIEVEAGGFTAGAPPAVTARSVRVLDAPPITGLLPRGAKDGDLDLRPTASLVTLDGRRVVVGWLRYVHLLDRASGRLLARARIPGMAHQLDYASDGSFRLSVQEASGLQVLRVAVEERTLTVRDGADRPLEPARLLPASAEAVDQLHRLACARLPAFDDLVQVWGYSTNERAPVVRKRFHVPPPPGFELELGFSQHGPTPCLAPEAEVAGPAAGRARTIAAVTTGSHAAGGWIRPGQELLAISLPTVGEPLAALRVLTPLDGEGPVEDDVSYEPVRLLQASEVQALIAAARALLAETDAPNPWEQAFLAVALSRLGTTEAAEEADRLARAAATSPLLPPAERVALACTLDRGGVEPAADLALDAALRELLSAGFVPDLAGYGPLDCGRPLARRVEELWIQGRAARAGVLARWRDAFAPALHEGPAALRGYASFGAAPAASPPASGLETPPPSPTAAPLPPKGLAGFDALDLQRMDHAIRLQWWFLFTVGAVLLSMVIVCMRHSARAKRRAGIGGPRAQVALWLSKPWTALYHSWPTFVTLPYKLALVLVYLTFFGVFAFQDAGLGVLVAHSRAPEPLLAGLPASPASLDWLAAEQAEAPDDPSLSYALAWSRAAAGIAPEPGAREALVRDGSPRALLLASELAGADRDPAWLGQVQGDPRLAPLAALVAGDAVAPAVLAEADPRLALALDRADVGPAPVTRASAPALPRPLAPPPTVAERDRLLVGSAAWSSQVPVLLGRNLVQPWPESLEQTMRVFESTYGWPLDLARERNDWFYLVPAALVLLIASLFVPSLHPYEPLKSDLDPPPWVKLSSLLLPGAPQLLRGRAVRGMALLIPAVYLIHNLVYIKLGYDIEQGFSTHLSTAEVAALTGENVTALRGIRVAHFAEMTLLLAVLYVVNWVELARARRKHFPRAEEGRRPERVIVPVDSVSLLPQASGPAPTHADGSDSDVWDTAGQSVGTLLDPGGPGSETGPTGTLADGGPRVSPPSDSGEGERIAGPYDATELQGPATRAGESLPAPPGEEPGDAFDPIAGSDWRPPSDEGPAAS
jgi:hypothetical protein